MIKDPDLPRTTRAILPLFLLATLVINLALPNQSHATTHAKLDFKRCQINQGAREITAQCATLLRPEDPSQPDGKTIELFVTKLASRASKPAADALTLIQGGPGGSSVEMLVGYAQLINGILGERDIIVIDQRGTGRSKPLNCATPANGALFEEFDQKELMRAAQECADQLNANPRFYTSSIAVQDLETLRKVAGYKQLTIYGASYGTRVALHYLRRYPAHTRALILDGVVDVGLNLAGAEIAHRSQDAFNNIATRCAESDTCRTQFGDIDKKFKDLRRRLKNGAITIDMPHPVNGTLSKRQVSEQDLLTTVRLLPYSTEGAAILPMIIAKAHAQNYLPLVAQSVMIGDSLRDGFATGMSNSVLCSEDAPFVTDEDLRGVENTYFGSSMVDAIRATCDVWPQGVIDSDFRKPFTSDKPVLILSGATDPITPPANGQRAHSMFSNALHLVVPAHGHGVLARGCIKQLFREFVEQTSLSGTDTSCVEREQPAPFFADFTGPNP